MRWLIGTVTSSIGKKQVMALTGLVFCLFLVVHFLGNLAIYGGKEAFNAYSERLHSLGLLLHVTEAGLIICALLHIFFALLLYIENLRARPVGYVMKKGAGGQTISSRIMPYTGLYILIFVVIHLITFTFAERADRTVFQLVSSTFTMPVYVVFYIFSVVVVAFHVKHGFWSAFQTVGASHPKYMPMIKGASWIFSLLVGVGFASVPVFILSST